MNTDFDSFFRNTIESLLIKSSWVGEVRERLGLDGLSQVWCDRPEWYFWIRGAPGPYSLALADAERQLAGGRPLVVGRFALKCYPYPQSGMFAGFSAEERAAVGSDLFDGTNTPRMEARDRLHDHWFTVGSVSVLLDEARTAALLSYDSLERLRLVSPADDSLLIRNVAGWEIGYPFFDCLIGMHAFAVRRPPLFVGASRSSGFEYAHDADHRLQCRPTDATRQLSLAVLFAEPSGPNGQADTLWRGRLDPEEEVTFDSRFTCAVPGAVRISGLPGASVNPLWWDFAVTDYRSELTSTCGCAEHEHHGCRCPHPEILERH